MCESESAVFSGFQDVEKIVEQIEKETWAERTKYDFKISLRIFFRWLRKTENYPKEVK